MRIMNHGAVLYAFTLIMMTSVDWKSIGFASGSRTDADDWNDWKRPVMSRERAKLLRKRTCYSYSSTLFRTHAIVSSAVEWYVPSLRLPY